MSKIEEKLAALRAHVEALDQFEVAILLGVLTARYVAIFGVEAARESIASVIGETPRGFALLDGHGVGEDIFVGDLLVVVERQALVAP